MSGPDFSDTDMDSVPSGISSTSNISGMVSSGAKPSPITPEQTYFVPVEIDPVTGRPKEPRTPIRRMESDSTAAIDTVESHDRSVPGGTMAKYGREMDSRDGYREQKDQFGRPVKGTGPVEHGANTALPGVGPDQNRPDGAPGDSHVEGADRPRSGRRGTGGTPENRGREGDYMDQERARQRGYNGTGPKPGGPNRPHGPQGHPGRGPFEENYGTLEDNNEVTPRKIRDDIPDSDLIDYEDDGEGESLLDGSELEFDDSMVRIFIALFDYDPMSQSPNPDAADEELPFKEGQLIKVCMFVILQRTLRCTFQVRDTEANTFYFV